MAHQHAFVRAINNCKFSGCTFRYFFKDIKNKKDDCKSLKEMHNRIFIFLVLCIASLLTSCRNEQEDKAYKELAYIDSVMWCDPHDADSLLAIIKDDIHNLPTDIQMKYAILYASCRNKLYEKMPEPKDFFKVVEYYDENGNQNDKMYAHYLLGCIYRDMDDAPEALKCYYDARNMITDTTKCDNRILMCVWGQMADVYRSQHIWKEEHEARVKYIQYARKIGNVEQELLGYEHLVKNYLTRGMESKVLELTKKVVAMYRAHGMRDMSASVYPYAINIYLDRGEFAKAHELMLKVEQESDMFDKDHNITCDRQIYYYHIGLYHLGVHQLDSAEYYFRKLAEYGEYTKHYYGMMKLYYDKNNTDSIFKYTKLYASSLEKQMGQLQTRSVYEMKSLYNYSHYKNDMLALRVKAQRNILIFCIVAGILFIAAASIYYYFSRKYKQKKKEIEIISQKYNTTKKKNQRLTDSLKQRAYINAEENVINSEIGHIIKHNPRFLTNADWNILNNLIKENMPCFYELINKSKLSTQEKQVCILIRFGCSTQAIMTILHLAHTSGVSNVKRSANKKLFSNDNTRSMYDSIIDREKEMMDVPVLY